MSTQDGFSNLLWFIGVVEDRKDPQKLGRIRVRCFDIHPDNKIDVPTEDLPWAIPILSNFNIDYKPPLTGSWVFGFFLDGRDAQHPMVIGVIPGMPTTTADNEQAFSGPDNYPSATDLYQPDIPRLARGESIDQTNILRRLSTRDTNPGYDWEEPETSYNAQYPYNKVHQTESGHIMEFDDTPGSERVYIEHTKGTFVEMQPNGSKISKIVGDNYTIIEKNDKLLIKGNVDIVIEGAKKVNIEGDCNLEIDGDYTTTVHGNYNMNVAGSIQVNSGNFYKQKSASITVESFLGDINHYSKSNYHVEGKNNVTLQANTGVLWTYSKQNTHIQSDANFGLYVANTIYSSAGGDTNIISTGDLAVEAARIDLNTDGAAAVDSAAPYGANPSLRTLLSDPPEFRFATVKNLQVDSYPKFINIDTEEPF